MEALADMVRQDYSHEEVAAADRVAGKPKDIELEEGAL